MTQLDTTPDIMYCTSEARTPEYLCGAARKGGVTMLTVDEALRLATEKHRAVISQIAALQAEAAQLEERVRVLQSVLESPKAVPLPQAPQVDMPKLSVKGERVLRFIGSELKTLAEIETFSNLNELGLRAESLRSLLSTYKLKHGLVTSPARAQFKLTEKGLALVQQLQQPGLL